MISLIIPPKDQISRAAKMLAEEYVSCAACATRLLVTTLSLLPCFFACAT
jgi:peptide subunit release factor 1 (eRF1)